MRRTTLLLLLIAVLPGLLAAQNKQIRVLVWSERTEPATVYPAGIDGAIAEALRKDKSLAVKTATIAEPDLGVSDATLAETDVLIWFGHRKHNDVSDEVVRRIVRHVKERGMGYLPVHSSHFARPFKAVLDEIQKTRDVGAWAAYINDGKPSTIRVVAPKHPIARGVKDFVIPKTERYDEPFQAPGPQSTIFEGDYADGRHARQGMVWTVGQGRVFYWRPGHEEYPIFFQPEVQKILRNAVHWLAGH
jgi:trehalose utilization protein